MVVPIHPVAQKVVELLEPHIEHQGYELVSVDFRPGARGSMLRVAVDKPEQGISLNEIERLTPILSDLLDVSKIQAGKIQFTFEPFDLNALILEAIETIRHTTSHEVHYQLSDLPIHLIADRQRIEQVLINLLSNAVKYSPNGEKIIIACEQEADHCRNQGELALHLSPTGRAAQPRARCAADSDGV